MQKEAAVPAEKNRRELLCSREIYLENEVVYMLDLHDVAAVIAAQPANGTAQSPKANQLIRRLTPLECERLQGFPDGWTLTETASDSARYKALGNSVAIPCVTFVLRGINLAARKEKQEEKENAV